MKRLFSLFILLFVAFSLFSCGAFSDIINSVADDSTSDPVNDEDTDEITESSMDNSVSDKPAMSDKIPNESSEITPEPKGSVSVVVLGDSIARGYGLENVDAQRFSSLLAEELETVYADVSVANYGVDGQTGAELLASLKENEIDKLDNCDHVIVSIGGNNILQVLTSLSPLLNDIGDVDPAVFKDYFLYLFAKDEQTKEKYSYSCKTINDIFKKVNAAFESAEFNALIDNAEKTLSDEIPLIVSEIKRINPNAKIYIQTVYNPYLNVNVTLEGVEEKLDLSFYGEKAVAKLNLPIASLAEENGYTVAPVWERFGRSKKPLTNAGFDISNTRFSVDPHPNSYGHIVIADIYFKLLTEDDNG